MEVTEAAETATDDQATEGQNLDSDALFQEALGQVEEPDDTPDEITPQELEIGGRKYSLPELEELTKLGQDAKEVKAEATRKFQEAAQLRDSVEDFRKLKEAWDSGDIGTRRTIVEGLRQQLGEPDAPAGDNTPDWDEMTPNEQALYRMNLDLKREMQRLSASVTPVLDETKGFLAQTKAEKEAAADAVRLKAQGYEITPQQIVQMRSKGVDPIAAAEFGLLAKPASQPTKPPPPGPPAKRDRVYDSRTLSADEIAYLASQGWTDAADA